MKKFIKRFFITIGVLLFLFILSAILVPILFKGKILTLVKKEMNDKLNATADFKDVDLSLFKHFPHLSVSIIDLSVVGKDAFKDDTLIAAKSIDVALDLMKAIKGDYDILNIGLISPRIHAHVLADGRPNWDITKPAPPTPANATPPTPFKLKLRKYGIENAFIDYNDEQGKMHLTIVNLVHEGSGDFTSDEFVLKTKTTADAISYAMGNVAYLSKVKTSLDLDLDINNKTSKYGFNTDKLQLNGLRMSFKGFVQMPDTVNTVMDVQFSTPSNDFKDILSLVPGIYQESFKDIKTTGKASLSGYVKGTMNKTKMPAFGVKLAVTDGSFQYPSLPDKVSNIQVKLDVDCPDGVMDHTVVNLEKGHIDFGTEPLDFRLLLKTPISNQWIDAALKAKIDLSHMMKLVKMDAGTKLSGIVTADMSVKGYVAAAQKGQYDQLDAKGSITIENVVYASKDYPSGVDVNSLTLTFNPKNVSVSNFKGKYLDIHFNGDGSINNFLGYYLHNEALDGGFHFAADNVDLNKLMGTSTATTPAAASAPTPVFIVPDNLNITLKAEVGSLKYDNLTLTGVSGAVVIRNQVVALQNVKGAGLDGTIGINGYYGTKNDKKSPDIAFEYALEGLDIQKTYNAFGMVSKMMPSAKYVSGKMTTHLDMTGKLGSDMMPVMNSLSGKGDVMLANAKVSGYPVTDQLADKLSMPNLKSFPIKDMKFFFTFENGRVTIKPYKMKIDQIDAEIAGSHGFDQTMNYAVNMAVPKTMLGTQGNAMLNDLLSKASAKGVNVKVGDKVNLTALITGTTTSPKIETNLKNVVGDAVNDMKKQLETEAKAKIDSVKHVVTDTLKSVGKQVVNQAKEELKNQITGKGNSGDAQKAVDDAKEKAKEGLKGLFKKK